MEVKGPPEPIGHPADAELAGVVKLNLVEPDRDQGLNVDGRSLILGKQGHLANRIARLVLSQNLYGLEPDLALTVVDFAQLQDPDSEARTLSTMLQ